MGQALSQLGELVEGKETREVTVVGLGYSGKTTIIHHLKTGQFAQFSDATIGFLFDTVDFKNFKINTIDIGGQFRLRECNYLLRGRHGILFVVDSNCRERIEDAKLTLHEFLNEDLEEAKGKPLLIFANKQDLPGAMDVLEITEKLDLRSLNVRHWHVQQSCAVSGKGLREGLEWLCRSMIEKASPPRCPICLKNERVWVEYVNLSSRVCNVRMY